MRTRDFNALNDLLFKFVFGHEERKAVTLSFINEKTLFVTEDEDELAPILAQDPTIE